MNVFSLKLRLTAMNFLEFAVWGAYLTSMGSYLAKAGLVEYIGWFYAVQGVVSIFMPGLMGIVADRWVPAQRLLGLCHILAGLFMGAASLYAAGTEGGALGMATFFTLYTFSVAFYMPTLALSNSVALNGLARAGLDTVAAFPPIRVFGTIGFICTMWIVSLMHYETTSGQFLVSAALSLLLGLYAQTLPGCPTSKGERRSLKQSLGLDVFFLFKQRRMAAFFLFSMLLGVSLQITNGFASPFIKEFENVAAYAGTFGVEYTGMLISLSQISEACCVLLIPFFLKRFGMKRVMMIAMLAWVLRFGFFGFGNPGEGVWLFVLSMLVYGVAFDFFNVSGALFVDQSTSPDIRSSAQGLFMIMTNGLGASIGTLSAQAVVNHYVTEGMSPEQKIAGWQTCWYIFAAYALVVLLLFAVAFKEKEAKAV